MGNNIQKKKKKGQTDKNFSSPPLSPNLKREKLNSLWLLGRPDKQRTAGPKGNEDQKRLTVHYTASQHYQENVFIEGSRSQYLEDLHTEAQEGLKILQQEENKNGANFADHESIDSTDTLCPEQEISSKDRGSPPESRSSIGNTDTTVNSAELTRPALTRQGSTFKPLNPVKKTERSRKRNRRTTIMGIPNQVQKELALHRSSTFQPLVSNQLPNHDKPGSESQSSVVVIPTFDGGTPVANKEGARVHLSELETFRGEALVSEHLCLASTLRPKSLAVPGMTTSFSFSPSTLNFLQEPQGPVMSISPQATYLSTIIPNAVLPASVEVIEIDRSISWTRDGSVNHGSSARTVSKSSLTSGDSAVSPLLSRRSDGDSSQTNSSNYETTLLSKSASGSNWSDSQSSKTIMSDSLAVSSNQVVQESPTEQSKYQDPASLQSSESVITSSNNTGENSTESGATESMAVREQAKNKHNFTHSLSVMKTKQPPAPPRRTNSLHGNKIRSTSKTIVEIINSASEEEKCSSEHALGGDDTKQIVTNVSPVPTPVSNLNGSSSAGLHLTPTEISSNFNGEAIEVSSSPSQKNAPEGEKFERTMSPSSGYSSQSGTPTLSPKGISSISPDKQKKPIKPERSASRASSSAASPSSSLTSLSSGTSELANADPSTCSTTLPPRGSSPPVVSKELTLNNNPSNIRVEFQELFNIPPPPKVKAPCPPPPETWAHNKRTVELLCGPCSVTNKIPQKPAQIQDSMDEQTEVLMEPKRETQTAKCVQEMSANNTKSAAWLEIDPDGGGDMEQTVKECSGTKQVQEEEEAESPREETVIDPEIQETTPKKDPPPIMKKPTRVVFSEEMERLLETQKMGTSSSFVIEVHLSEENHETTSQDAVMIVVEKSENEMEKSDVQSMHTLSIETPKISKISPPPTPPPTYHPTPPMMRKTPSSSKLQPPKESHREQESANVEDPCWPPPPPPLEGDSVFDGGDEVDFPPPPPPSLTDSLMDVTDPNPTVSQSAVIEVSKLDTALDDSSQLVQNISCIADRVSPAQVDVCSVSPVTIAESPVSVTAVVPPSSFLKLNSLKTEEQPPSAHVSAQISAPNTMSTAPSPPTESPTHGVNFRRRPSGAHRDARSKELLSRHKSPPMPKEDANIPLVTPSLLQMVRLRSVSMTEDQVNATSEDKSKNVEAPAQENNTDSTNELQNIPQKPIRKSLSLKSSPPTVKTPTVTMTPPSTRLQEAIRMKTAAMSSRDGLPPRKGVRLPIYSYVGEPGLQPLKLPESYDMNKSPASTASFIFSRSTKKIVMETVAASSSEAQACLKQSLAAELRQVSDQSKPGTFSNGGVKCDKVPPPVAKKPSSLNPSHNSHSPSVNPELSVEGNGALGGIQHMSGVAPTETTTRVTADTIETLF
uniref:KIAA1522 n=1 Tax=Iconisemion striatum TaxID=60296 RepID=A0A1A7WJK7_9TELE